MSTDYIYASADNDVNIKVKSSKKIEKGLKKLLVIAVIIFSAQLIWLFGITPFFPFSTIETHGFAGFENAQVVSFAGITETSSFMSTNVIEVQERLASNLLVESAVVTKRFPDKLSIIVIPRQTAAVTLATIGSRQLPLFIDKKGVFYKYGDASSQEAAGLPIISGIENPILNMRFPAALVPLAESIYEISSSSPELLAAISEIRIERKPWEGFDLVLFPVHSSIKVRIENNLSEDILRYMLLMLNIFDSSSSKPEEIDFRSGMGSYKIKEKSL